jgi:hypothetical protein
MIISDLDYLEKTEETAKVEGGWVINTNVITAVQVAQSQSLAISYAGDATASATAGNLLRFRRVPS